MTDTDPVIDEQQGEVPEECDSCGWEFALGGPCHEVIRYGPQHDESFDHICDPCFNSSGASSIHRSELFQPLMACANLILKAIREMKNA